MGLLSPPSSCPSWDLQQPSPVHGASDHTSALKHSPSLDALPAISPCPAHGTLLGSRRTELGLVHTHLPLCPASMAMVLGVSQELTNSAHVLLGGRSSGITLAHAGSCCVSVRGKQQAGRASHCMLPSACSPQHAPCGMTLLLDPCDTSHSRSCCSSIKPSRTESCACQYG